MQTMNDSVTVCPNEADGEGCYKVIIRGANGECAAYRTSAQVGYAPFTFKEACAFAEAYLADRKDRSKFTYTVIQ